MESVASEKLQTAWPVPRETRFRIFAEPADENYFVDGHENTCLLMKYGDFF